MIVDGVCLSEQEKQPPGAPPADNNRAAAALSTCRTLYRKDWMVRLSFSFLAFWFADLMSASGKSHE